MRTKLKSEVGTYLILLMTSIDDRTVIVSVGPCIVNRISLILILLSIFPVIPVLGSFFVIVRVGLLSLPSLLLLNLVLVFSIRLLSRLSMGC